MNLHRLVAARPAAPAGRLLGVVLGVVTNNDDPDKLGRVKVKFPWLADGEESAWAPVAAWCGSGKQGVFAVPEVGDQVLLALELGDVDRPFVLGGVWSSADPPPTADGDGRDRKVFRSRSGHLIRIDDTGGGEKIEILDKTGKNTVTIDSAANTITIAADKDIVLEAPRGKVTIEAKDLELKASGSAKLEASGTLTLKGATVNVN